MSRTLALALVLSMPAGAQDAAPRLQLTAANGQTVFHIGERIPIELSFTALDGKRFEISMASYDRSGRMAHEDFDITPATGWTDPLQAFFGSVMGYMGGGLSSRALLSAKPEIVPLNLNEWARFDQPGTYQITITSHRVSDTSREFNHRALSLKSNPIQIQITPATPAWQKAKLAAIVNALQQDPKTPGIPRPELTAAIADLRFLNTPAAAQLMAQHLREDEQNMMYQCAFGLIGLPENLHAAALTALNKQLDDPNFPVSRWLLDTISVLQLTSADPAQQREDRQRFEIANWELAMQALPAKQGAARAVTAQMLANGPPAPLSPQDQATLARILGSSLIDLPREAQMAQLQYHWDLLRSQNLVPTLQQLARAPIKNPGGNEFPSYIDRALKSAALQRWYEIDPEGAHEEILRQIGSPHPSLPASSLAFLPKEQLPQFEGVWADAFTATDDYEEETLLASLLAKFGAGSAEAQVREKVDAKLGPWACAPQGAALGYLVEFDPASARPLVERAIRERGEGKSACNRSVLENISTYATDPSLIEIAIQTLADPDPQVSVDALQYLRNYGDASAQQPIWNRYVEWTEKWRGQADILESREAGTNGNWQEMALGANLAAALLENQGWLADSALIASVRERCVGEQMCTQLKQITDQAQVPHTISAFFSGEAERYQVAQYSPKTFELLQQKIEQYPRGTAFTLVSNTPDSSDQNHLDDQIRNLLEKNGMKLQLQPPNPGLL